MADLPLGDLGPTSDRAVFRQIAEQSTRSISKRLRLRKTSPAAWAWKSPSSSSCGVMFTALLAACLFP